MFGKIPVCFWLVPEAKAGRQPTVSSTTEFSEKLPADDFALSDVELRINDLRVIKQRRNSKFNFADNTIYH